MIGKRHEYVLDLSRPRPTALQTPSLKDDTSAALPVHADRLAVLMLDAYRGSIDYQDETLTDAVAEVEAYFGGRRGGPALPDHSRLAWSDSQLAAACLVAQWDARQCPFIAYVMTHPQWKNQGLARHLLGAVLQELRSSHREVRAIVTEGNTPSERLFRGMLFQRVEPFAQQVD